MKLCIRLFLLILLFIGSLLVAEPQQQNYYVKNQKEYTIHGKQDSPGMWFIFLLVSTPITMYYVYQKDKKS